MIQTEIDFTNVVHVKENNRGSQLILEDQYSRLNKNCRKLYDALKSGQKMMMDYLTKNNIL